jgi:hypothetical protein
MCNLNDLQDTDRPAPDDVILLDNPAVRGHTSARERCGAPTHTQQENPQSQRCSTVPKSLRSKRLRAGTPKTRLVHRQHAHSARMTQQPRFPTGIFDELANTSRTFHLASVALIATVNAHTRTHRSTRRDKPHPAQRRHVHIMARVTQNKARRQATHVTSHTTTQNTNTSPARPQETPRTAAITGHCANITAHAPLQARRTPHGTKAPRTRRRARRKTHPVIHAAAAPHSRQSCQAAQRRRDAAGELAPVQVQRPAGYTNSHHVTPWHPMLLLSSLHSIDQIKSNEMKSSQHCKL